MTRKLILMNGLAVLGVVVHHATAFGFSALFEWTDRYRPVSVPNFDALGSLQCHALLIVRQLDAFAIPAFLFVSGFFITAFTAGGGERSIGLRDVWPRIRIFLIPFVVWTIVRYVLLRRFPTSLHEILRPYYYIPLVIQFYLLAPVLIPIARRYWQPVLLGTFVIQVLPETIYWYLDAFGVQAPELIPLYLFPRRLAWFTLGVVASCHLAEFSHWLRTHRRMLLIGTLILGGLTLVEYEAISILSSRLWIGPNFWGIARQAYAISFILAVLAHADARWPLEKSLSALGGKSLGIYLANIPAIYVIGLLMYRFTPRLLGNQLVYQSVLILTGLGIPLLLMEWTKHSPLRRSYRYLFG